MDEDQVQDQVTMSATWTIEECAACVPLYMQVRAEIEADPRVQTQDGDQVIQADPDKDGDISDAFQLMFPHLRLAKRLEAKYDKKLAEAYAIRMEAIVEFLSINAARLSELKLADSVTAEGMEPSDELMHALCDPPFGEIANKDFEIEFDRVLEQITPR
ncbi:MAG: hypothetical protein AAF663_06245 [Planctomycetota bacterium]